MALQFDLSKIYRWKSVCTKSKKTYEWTNHFIWACMAIRMPEITEKNWREWATRYLLVCPPQDHWTEARKRRYTKTVVKKVYQHIGLWTNVDKPHQKPTGLWYKATLDQMIEQTRWVVDQLHVENCIANNRRKDQQLVRRHKKKMNQKMAAICTPMEN